MPFEVSWLVDQRVVYVRTYGEMTMSEMQESSVQSRKLCEEGIPFVYVISDATDLVKVQVKLQDVLAFFRGAKVIDKVGWSVFVGATSVERFFFAIISQFNNNNHRTFSKLEDAVAFIQSADDGLPVIPMPGHVNK
jgi:hypothetical protein